MNKRKDLVKIMCDKHPNKGNLTIAKLLYQKYPREFNNLESARTAVRYCRGQGGKNNRKSVDVQRMSQGLRKPPPIPKSCATPWDRVYLQTKRLGVISDIHVPYHDEVALAATFDYFDRWKPDTILINGDFFDFYMISRFPKKKNRPTLKQELDLGKQLLKHIVRRYPKAKIVYKLGNHDERYEAFLWDCCPEIFEIASNAWRDVCGLNELGIEVVDNQAIVMAGKLPILHGHELPKGIASPVNPARGAFLRTSHPVLCGHFHQDSKHSNRPMIGSPDAAWTTGCLCDLTPEYARINKWNHGFATVEVGPDLDYVVALHSIVNGRVY